MDSKAILPFKACSTLLVSGPTRVGKTMWVHQLLKHKDTMFDIPSECVLYCYGIFQPLYDVMESTVPGIVFHAGLPSEELLEEYTTQDGHNLVVIDDLFREVIAQPSMERLFTLGAHHRRLSVIFISQSLFPQSKFARTIALNTHYLILMKSLRDVSQISTLGRQLYPTYSKFLIESYIDCMKSDPYPYLVVDTAPHSDSRFRLRSNIFPGEYPTIYQPGS